MITDTSLALIACALCLIACYGWAHTYRKSKRLLATSRDLISRRARLQQVELLNPHHAADAIKEFIYVIDPDGRTVPIGFTDKSYMAARIHGNQLVEIIRSGRAKIIG